MSTRRLIVTVWGLSALSAVGLAQVAPPPLPLKTACRPDAAVVHFYLVE